MRSKATQNDKKLLDWPGRKITWFRPEALAETRKLIEKYYNKKIRNALLRYEVESALRHMQKDPAFPALELTYKEQWHPEHIAAELKCTEKLVHQLVDKTIKQAALLIFGVDALEVEHKFLRKGVG